jgi:hypothetical protein
MAAPTNSTLFASLIGQTAQGCWLGYGNCLFLEFGQSHPPGPRETHPRGEWEMKRRYDSLLQNWGAYLAKHLFLTADRCSVSP